VDGTAVGTFSCVVDADPRFHLEALRWYATLRLVVGADPADLVVHAWWMPVGRARVPRTRRLDPDVEPSTPAHPTATRSPAPGPGGPDDRGLAVLSDADVVILEDRVAFHRGDSVGRSPSSAPPVASRTAAGVRRRRPAAAPAVAVGRHPDKSRSPETQRRPLPRSGPACHRASAWERWARCSEHIELLERWQLNVDQVSMAMASLGGDRTHPAGRRWNFPTHERKRLPTSITPASPLPQRGEHAGAAHPDRVDAVDRQIEVANAPSARSGTPRSQCTSGTAVRHEFRPGSGSGAGQAVGGQARTPGGPPGHPATPIRSRRRVRDGETTRTFPSPTTSLDLSEEAIGGPTDRPDVTTGWDSRSRDRGRVDPVHRRPDHQATATATAHGAVAPRELHPGPPRLGYERPSRSTPHGALPRAMSATLHEMVHRGAVPAA